ncbi:hypothetical protein AGR4A_Lc110044 [Agrobacterium tumefaciens str. B6]|uniref:Uncharacterized protein n=1 Tax=Agrobacterium tumefaciens str. B6 TaxID=1183423 RepID=A0A822V5K7_AGRTU|nr:hypothetical protein AGR4A_Lc110044 [Agrobacterium tumefaciens str. B6]
MRRYRFRPGSLSIVYPVKASEQNFDAIAGALRPREYGNVDTPKPEDYCLAQLSYQSLAHTLTESAP